MNWFFRRTPELSPQEKLNRRFWDAFFKGDAKGDLRQARKLLEQGADINARGESKHTPLTYAVFCQDARISLLIDWGADVNADGGRDYSPLGWTTFLGQTELARLLIRRDAKVDAQVKASEWTPLMLAAQEGCLVMARILLESGADIERRDRRGYTALAHAADSGWLSIVRLLLERGADFRVQNKEGQTPLAVAHAAGYAEIVNVLREAGDRETVIAGSPPDADPRLRYKYGNPNEVLLTAAEKGDQDAMEWALRNGADVNYVGVNPLFKDLGTSYQDLFMSSALLLAAKHGHAQAVQIGSLGETAFHAAIQYRRLEAIQAFVDAGVNVNRPIKSLGLAQTPLEIAVGYRQVECVECLLQAEVEVNAKDNVLGQTPLMKAATSWCPELLETLLKAGADVHATTDEGLTALILAARDGYIHSVRILLEHGAHANLQDDYGRTALILAARQGYTEVVKLLLQHGARTDLKTRNAFLAWLHDAVRGHYFNV